MHSPNRGATLATLEFDALPQVTELHGSFAWAQWTAAVAALKKACSICCHALTGADADPDLAWCNTVQLYPEDLIQLRLARMRVRSQQQ